jgi:hypothetical protein
MAVRKPVLALYQSVAATDHHDVQVGEAAKSGSGTATIPTGVFKSVFAKCLTVSFLYTVGLDLNYILTKPMQLSLI